MGEFGNRLYELRRKSGMSQEQLAEKLNVSRQTLSKWELGESTPDMERLIAISDLYDISLDELVLGREAPGAAPADKVTVAEVLEQKVLTDDNRQKAKKAGKILLILLGVVFAADIISMVIYFILYGAPT